MDFFFQLNLLPPYSLHSQGDKEELARAYPAVVAWIVKALLSHSVDVRSGDRWIKSRSGRLYRHGTMAVIIH